MTGKLDAADIAIDAAKAGLIALAKYLQSVGHDPKALLNAELDAADVAAFAELDAKFPGEK